MKLAMVILGHVKAIDVSDAAWMEWRQVHGRSYSSAAEETMRRAAWERFSFEVERRNARNPHATFAAGRFADFTEDDLLGLTGSEGRTLADSGLPKTLVNLSSSDIVELEASAIDWRGSDLVTPVKDQWPCGSCWAFRSTGLQEAAWSKAGHGLVPLSEQKMVDCNCPLYPLWVGPGPEGCHMASEADYPYRRGDDGGCEQKGCHEDTPVAAKMASTECIDSPDPEAAALQWLQDGPVGADILAGDALYQYDSGIITDCDGPYTNHAVMVVGYGEEDGLPYWLIKNSWGGPDQYGDTAWGEGGYFRVQYGVKCLGLGLGCRMHALDGPTPTPTPTPVPPPPTPTPPPPPCSFIGEVKDFVGGDVRPSTYTGDTDEEKDADCCAQCDAEPQCEYWVRATDTNDCWLKRDFQAFGENPNRRGNFQGPAPAPIPTPTPTPPTPSPSQTTCRCDSPGGLAPNNHFTCTDASRTAYCAATEKCVAAGDFDPDVSGYCQRATICSCDSPGQCCVGSNHFTCSDSERSGYCAEDQMCNVQGDWEHPSSGGGDFSSICVHAGENVIV